MQSLSDIKTITLDNKIQNDINKRLHLDRIENYEFHNIEELKKSNDSILIDGSSQSDTLSQTSDSSMPISNKIEKKNSINKGFGFEKNYVPFYLGYEDYYKKLMPEKFIEYKKSRNYLSKNSCLKKIEPNNYINYTIQYINYFHYSDYALFNTKTYENGFPFYIYNNNYNKEDNNKIDKEEIMVIKGKENEDNKDKNKQINNRKEEKEEKDKDNYLNRKNKYINRKNQYQKYNNNKGHKFKYYKRERYINRKNNKFSKFNFCDNYRAEKYKYYNSYYY